MKNGQKSWRRVLARALPAAALITLLGGAGQVGAGGILHAFAQSASGQTAASSSCGLSNGIQHVIEIQFDNFHFTRDNPNVPSDLEQVPNLLNFIKSEGTLSTNHHTPLISHTADDILTTLTGVYPNRHGIPVANSFRYFTNSGASTLSSAAFGYWTDPVSASDPNYLMINDQAKNAPAPWVPFTRAGCDVGMVATANTVFENTTNDINTVFGSSSPQAAEAKANPSLAQTDFVGIGVHCGMGGGICNDSSNARPDVLPQEPGGYSGFQALYGAKYVDPVLGASNGLSDFNGNTITDPAGNPGFPGFDGMSADNSLSYVAAMQEHGVPVTYAYISDAHDGHIPNPAKDSFDNVAYGPGQAGYVAQLRSYNTAFGQFFSRLAADGITPANTLFVFTADENDHLVAGPPSPANCDGVTVTCNYTNLGEINANLTGLLATEQGIAPPAYTFTVHSDDAPTFYLNGHPGSNYRGAADTAARTFERATSQLTATNPMTGATDHFAWQMVDPVGEQLLHMVTADSARTPTFTLFADPNYFLFAGAPNCSAPCVTQAAPGGLGTFAWNHGDVQPDITTTWLGLVGPGVQNLGVTDSVWSDHTDVRPTILALTGLTDDYGHDGRALAEFMQPNVLPQALHAHHETFLRLAAIYKQLNASVGQFGLDAIAASTTALKSGSTADDATYTSIESQLQSLGAQRDTLANTIKAELDGATFDGRALNEQTAKAQIAQAQGLLAQMDTLAGS